MPKREPKGLPPGVHRKRAKGKTYYYFDMGKRNGKQVLKRLPDILSDDFGPAYSVALTQRGRIKPVTAPIGVSDFIREYEKSPEFNRRAPSTQRTYLIYLRYISEQMLDFPAEQVKRKDVIALIDKMGSRTGAANMVLAVMGALYTWGRKREIVTVKPTAEIDGFDTEDYEPWPELLLQSGLQAEDDTTRTAIALLYFTAQRIGDVCKLRWSDIHDGIIFVRQQKTKTELEIPVHADLLKLLPKPEAMTILHHKGKPYASSTIREYIKAWLVEQGHGSFVPHGLRKNAVNALLEAGCSAAETSSISGQSLQIVEHYAKRRNRRKLASAAVIKWQGRNAS